MQRAIRCLGDIVDVGGYGLHLARGFTGRQCRLRVRNDLKIDDFRLRLSEVCEPRQCILVPARVGAVRA